MDLFPDLLPAEEPSFSKVSLMPLKENHWKPTQVKDLPNWDDVTKVSVDCETKDPLIKKLGTGCRRPDSYVVGYSFAFERNGKTEGYYVPFKHEAGGNVDFDHAKQYLQDNAKAFKGELVGMNLAYDIDWLKHDLGVTWPGVRFFRDIGIADPLIYELHMFYNMDAIAKRHGLEGKDETLLQRRAAELGLNPKADLWKMHSSDVGPYGVQDAILPLQVLQRQQAIIDEQDLQRIFDLESEVLPVLVTLRERGVRINENALAQIERLSLEEEGKALAQVTYLTGVKIKLGDVMKAAKLAPALEKVGIKLPRTSQGKPSIKKDDMLNYNHPVADALNRARMVNKLRTTFAASIRRHMIKGRIHASFKQIAQDDGYGETQGARFGRLSSTNPNIQQQPSRGEFAKAWRAIYLPEDGAIWACNDYSQQEPRWTTHFANLMGYRGAAEAAHEYRTNPKADNHDMMAKLTGLPRGDAKAIFLGLCYGEGGAKLCKTLKLPTRWCLTIGNWNEKQVFYFEDEAEARKVAKDHKDVRKFLYETAGKEGQNILDQFDEKTPFVKKLSKRVQAKAGKYGFITTAGGRKLNFEENVDASGYGFTYRALNRLIQGSSADQMKRAMVDVYKEVPEFFMQLQVHDELDGSAENPAVAKRAARIMRESTLATVPFRVDVDLGPNWGNLVDSKTYEMGKGWEKLVKELNL
jgi:DNA polymerase I-like protein with 3'-5' exonuclease and polymerase domains